MAENKRVFQGRRINNRAVAFILGVFCMAFLSFFLIRKILGIIYVDPQRDIWLDQDKWSVRTRDGQPAAHFEHTIVVRKGKAEILSSFEEAMKVEGVLY